MHRNEFELSELVQARRDDIHRGTRRPAVPPVAGHRPINVRVRRAIGLRFVAIGTALVGPL